MKKFMITLFLFVLVLGGLILYARFAEPSMLVVKSVKVAAPGQLKIAYFSDTHFGKDYEEKNIERIVAKINAAEPDLVVFGGDFYDNYNRDKTRIDLDYMGKQLSKIQGEKFAVRGNHDCGGGAEFIYGDLMEAGGFRLLVNEMLYLEEYDTTLVGYDDNQLGVTDESLFTLSTGTYNLLLLHEPDLAESIDSDTPGLALAGHSHGGQVNLPILTQKILPPGAKKYSKGLYSSAELGGNNQLFVSSGIGTTVLPVRFLNVPEVVVLDLDEN